MVPPRKAPFGIWISTSQSSIFRALSNKFASPRSSPLANHGGDDVAGGFRIGSSPARNQAIVTRHPAIVRGGMILRARNPGQRFSDRGVDWNFLTGLRQLLALHFRTGLGRHPVLKTHIRQSPANTLPQAKQTNILQGLPSKTVVFLGGLKAVYHSGQRRRRRLKITVQNFGNSKVKPMFHWGCRPSSPATPAIRRNRKTEYRNPDRSNEDRSKMKTTMKIPCSAGEIAKPKVFATDVFYALFARVGTKSQLFSSWVPVYP